MNAPVSHARAKDAFLGAGAQEATVPGGMLGSSSQLAPGEQGGGEGAGHALRGAPAPHHPQLAPNHPNLHHQNCHVKPQQGSLAAGALGNEASARLATNRRSSNTAAEPAAAAATDASLRAGIGHHASAMRAHEERMAAESLDHVHAWLSDTVEASSGKRSELSSKDEVRWGGWFGWLVGWVLVPVGGWVGGWPDSHRTALQPTSSSRCSLVGG